MVVITRFKDHVAHRRLLNLTITLAQAVGLLAGTSVFGSVESFGADLWGCAALGTQPNCPNSQFGSGSTVCYGPSVHCDQKTPQLAYYCGNQDCVQRGGTPENKTGVEWNQLTSKAGTNGGSAGYGGAAGGAGGGTAGAGGAAGLTAPVGSAGTSGTSSGGTPATSSPTASGTSQSETGTAEAKQTATPSSDPAKAAQQPDAPIRRTQEWTPDPNNPGKGTLTDVTTGVPRDSATKRISDGGSYYSNNSGAGGAYNNGPVRNSDGSISDGQGNSTYTTDNGTVTKTAEGKYVVRSTYKAGQDDDGNQYNYKEHRTDDECGTSAKVDGSYACDTTRSTIENADLTNKLTQAGGMMTTQVMGMNAQMSAVKQGTQSAALRGAASLQKVTGMMQMGMGAMNAGLGTAQIMQGSDHKSYAKEFKTASTQGRALLSAQNNNLTESDGRHDGEDGYVQAKDKNNTKVAGLTNKIVDNFEINQRSGALTAVYQNDPNAARKEAVSEMRKTEKVKKLNFAKGEVTRISSDAASEQTKIGKAATNGGIMSYMTSATQLIGGVFNIMAANEMKKAANAMDNAQNQMVRANPFQFDNSGMADQPGSPRTPTTITGTGAAAEQAAQDDAKDKTDNGGGLGTPFNPQAKPDSVKDTGPEPGKLGKGDPGGAGGGGGGAMGSASTSPSTASSEEPAATRADNRGAPAYESGGGGGGGRGGGGEGNGPDLSGLLAKFLPQEDKPKPDNNILQFGGERGLASADNSILGRNADLFKRIHDTYEDKHRRGFIGL